MARLETLVTDIEKVLTSPRTVARLSLEAFGNDVGAVIGRSLEEDGSSHGLRMSNLGTPCVRALQYRRNPNVKGEEFPPNIRLKFMFGHVIEALILLLAREAGHEVVGEQTPLDIDGVPGHRDAIIDGVLVDVKSASTRAFSKFSNGLSVADDAFGYLVQLGAYHFASRTDPLLRDLDRAAFLVVDKQFGHICLDIHTIDKDVDYVSLVRDRRRRSEPTAPLAPRAFFDEPDGASGNRKLGTSCSYCSFKYECWPGLQTYLYSSGPRFLTRVLREPKVDKA